MSAGIFTFHDAMPFLLHNNINLLSVTARKSQHTTTRRSPAARPPGPPEAQRTTRHITTRDLKGPSSEGPTLSADPTTQLFPSSEPQTVTSAQSSSSTHSHLSGESNRLHAYMMWWQNIRWSMQTRHEGHKRNKKHPDVTTVTVYVCVLE